MTAKAGTGTAVAPDVAWAAEPPELDPVEPVGVEVAIEFALELGLY